jgi:hypothetical protein
MNVNDKFPTGRISTKSLTAQGVEGRKKARADRETGDAVNGKSEVESCLIPRVKSTADENDRDRLSEEV